MMESAVLGWVSQVLQHEVIAMASCCKKGGGQKGNNCHRQTCSGATGITVLRRDFVCDGWSRTSFHLCAADWVTRILRLVI
ncbi:hypothetical protein CYD69_25135 [Klebsiella pneumoniae]|nr:hypothetical protein CYD69_25135 [Klebsiella pneumoniae]PKT34900.1 hypothetical protein CYD70_25390 [Klebsiella pneumoniae]